MSMSRRSESAMLRTATDLSAEAVSAVTGALNPLLADAFALYLKTKNFHWHMSGPHFRDYHLLLDEQGEQIFAMTDELAERVRKIGGATVKSIGHVARLQRIKDNNEEFVAAVDMLRELMEDNKAFTTNMREAHESLIRTTTRLRPACSKISSTRRNGAPGSCSRRPASRTSRMISGSDGSGFWLSGHSLRRA